MQRNKTEITYNYFWYCITKLLYTVCKYRISTCLICILCIALSVTSFLYKIIFQSKKYGCIYGCYSWQLNWSMSMISNFNLCYILNVLQFIDIDKLNHINEIADVLHNIILIVLCFKLVQTNSNGVGVMQ